MVFEFGIAVAPLPDKLCKEVLADARSGDSAGADDPAEGVVVGIPEGVGDDRAGEVGNGRGEGEEAVAVNIMARGDLGEQGIADLAFDGAAVAGDVLHVLLEDGLHGEADIAVDGSDGNI